MFDLFWYSASINCIAFDRQASDEQCISQLLSDVQTTFSMHPVKRQMRHKTAAESDAAKADGPAEIPLAVPDLPPHVVERPGILTTIQSHLLPPAADGDKVSSLKTGKVIAHGQVKVEIPKAKTK